MNIILNAQNILNIMDFSDLYIIHNLKKMKYYAKLKHMGK
jgi:predicted aldo/keto reductase-like oxidoreductase